MHVTSCDGCDNGFGFLPGFVIFKFQFGFSGNSTANSKMINAILMHSSTDDNI